MTQPFGFVPPVFIPAIGGAANAIIPTAGILGGVAAGAKAGSVLGPQGALAGGLIGGILGGLLLPLPTNPGTIPGLDPGVNDPQPAPEPEPGEPDGEWPMETPPAPVGQTFLFRFRYYRWRYDAKTYNCTGNGEIAGTDTWSRDPSFTSVIQEARSLSIVTSQGGINRTCEGDGYVSPPPYTKAIIGIKYIDAEGNEQTRDLLVESDYILGTNGALYQERAALYRAQTYFFSVDGVPIPDPIPKPVPKPKPRPLPIIPLTVPDPEPAPAPVPIPEPEPQPLPLEVPSPNNPTAPPITIPKAPPAEPKAPPKPKPFPIPGPSQPGTVPIPLPIPGVPTIPEPSPDPKVVPAPGPIPLPSPGPAPVPGTDPQPAETPIPVPPQTPIPTIPATPKKPDTSTPTKPDGSVAPEPSPITVPTPTDTHFPVPGKPGVKPGGTRPDIAAIAAEVGRIEQKTAQLQNNQADIPWWLIGPILEALGALLEQDIPGTTYQLQGICEEVEEGQPQPIAEFKVESAKNIGAIINRLDTIDQMLQQHLAWKTPICKPCITPKGDWRTISFISDEVSPYGNSRLRKRFRYRSTSGLGLPGVIDHWKDFVWQAGPVCVQHADADWGTPQCWASSVNEGKRVIRHAAGEAGLDPDQDGRWVVSGSDSARVGVPGTMRVNRKGGYYWITARDGSEGRPIVGTVDSNP